MSKFSSVIAKFDNYDAKSISDSEQLLDASNDIEAIHTWLAEYRKSKNTFISYRTIAERFMLWLDDKDCMLSQVSRELIQEYQMFLEYPTPSDKWCGLAKPRNHEEWKPFVKGLSNSSVTLNLRILKGMFSYLIEMGYLQKNPFRLIRQSNTSANKKLDRYMTYNEWRMLLEYVEQMPKNNQDELLEYHRVRWIFCLLYLTACRRSEVVNAKMSDFIRKRNQWWLVVTGKGNKTGEIPVTSDLLQELMLYRKVNGLSEIPSVTENRVPLVFKINNKKIEAISDSMLYKIIKKTCTTFSEELKATDPAASFVFAKVSTHWMRHTSATHQVDAGIDIRVVKDNLRHSQIETTIKYQHSESDMRHQETLDKFGK